MNTIVFARDRENRIQTLLSTLPYLTTSTLVRKYFTSPRGYDKGTQVLRRMVKRGMLKRFRHGGEYVYHIGPRSSQWQHIRKISLFYLRLEENLKPWQKILFYRREYDYGFGRADALYIVQTTIDGGGVKFFLEMDDMTHKFDKVVKYEEYYHSRLWLEEEWATLNGKTSFPVVLVVSERAIFKSKTITVMTCRPEDNVLTVLQSRKTLSR